MIIGLCVGLIPDWGAAEINTNVTTTAIMQSTLPATTAETVPYINSSLVLAIQERIHDFLKLYDRYYYGPYYMGQII